MGVCTDMTPDRKQRLIGAALSLTGFASLNIGLNFFNSWALNRSGAVQFTFPFFYTMFHAVATCLFSLLVMLMKKPETGYPSFNQLWDYKLALLPLAICTTLNVVCNNASLGLLSLFLNQVIKATAPLPTMCFSFAFEKKTFTVFVIAMCGVVVGGTILSIPMKAKKGEETSGLGIVLVLISLVAASLKPVIMKIVMGGLGERPKLPPTVVLFYDMGVAFFFMCAGWLIRELQPTLEYLRSDREWLGIGVICAGATMAFLFNLSTYYLVQFTGSVTSTVASNGVKVVNIVISALIASPPLSDPRNWCGVSVVCLGIIGYAFAMERAKSHPPKPLSNPFVKKDPEQGLNEATPLTGEGASTTCCAIS